MGRKNGEWRSEREKSKQNILSCGNGKQSWQVACSIPSTTSGSSIGCVNARLDMHHFCKSSAGRAGWDGTVGSNMILPGQLLACVLCCQALWHRSEKTESLSGRDGIIAIERRIFS